MIETPLGKIEKTLIDIKNRGLRNPWKTAMLMFIALSMIIGFGYFTALGERFASPTPSGHKFSTFTSVYMREYPADKNFINLDNTGSLRPYSNPYHQFNNENQVQLVLNLPITVLSEVMAPVSNGSAYGYKYTPKEKDIYTFNLSTQKSHKIKLKGRVFIVTLFNIKDISKSEDVSINQYDVNFEYQFGVTER